jgi:integrase
MKRGTWRDPEAGRERFDEYTRRWLIWREPRLSPSTFCQYQSLVRCHLEPTFGHLQLDQIDTPTIRTWNAQLSKSSSGVAVSAYRLLRAILNTAVDDDAIPRNPCRVKGAGSDRAPERVPPTLEEVRALTNAMPAKLKLTVILACAFPVRKSELLGLQRCDINLLQCTISIQRQLAEVAGRPELKYRRTKNGETGIVELDPVVMVVVEQHLKRFVGPEQNAPLFPALNGQPIRPSSFWHYWDRARKQTGLTHYHFHDLRHYAGTMLAASGASVSEIQKRGRWKSTSMPLRYQHATKERDNYLAHATAAFVPLPEVQPEEIAPAARPNPLPTRPFTFKDALTSENDENCSGGETRTLNLAVNSRLLCH